MYNQNGYPGMTNPMDIQNACQRYMNYYVTGQLADGSQVEGIITDMDDNGVEMMVPEEVQENTADMRYGYGGYGGYNGYDGYDGYGYGYGRPRRRYRRFRRRRYPYAQFVFPFILPFPFYY
ncbi:hypothetical protein IM538_08935 [Cytobacillus suaedae]|nr:hypothetical protein IM538_08935 [Cytobacillus suaedae]